MNKTFALFVGLVASSAVMATTASSARAASLVPSVEGEVNVGLGCLTGTCISLPSLISSVTSLVDTTTGTKSRLFVDNLATANTYDGGGLGTVKFGTVDAGTNPLGFWFRPSEAKANGAVGEEKGQLEVGTFTFTFARAINLTVRYFDTETSGTTGIMNTVLDTDGILTSGSNIVPGGPNGNIYIQTLKNVSFLTLKLGQDTTIGTGDGVDFQLEAVPEPSMLVGLGMVGAGLLANRRRRKSQAA